MKKIIYVLLAFMLAFVLLKLFVFSTDKPVKVTDDDYRKAFKHSYKIFAPEIPDKLDFAGEDVPVKMYFVRESLDREIIVNTYWHSNTILMFKRAYRWFPVIEPILKKNNIHDDFKYLALIESGFMNVTSPAGAKGFWQFMKTTGKSYGLEINSEVDERYNLEKATEAACQYLHESNKIFNNWTLVAASYNMGMGGLRNRLKEQKVDSYFDLFLNAETARYIYRILAVKTIFQNPTNYGFYLRKKDLYQVVPYSTITVDSAISNLADFAIQQGINYKILKDFNPWLRNKMLTNKYKKTYYFKIPEKEFLNHENQIKDLKDDNSIYKDTVEIHQLK